MKVYGQAGALAGVQGRARRGCEGYAAVRALVCGPTLVARGGLEADVCGVRRGMIA